MPGPTEYYTSIYELQQLGTSKFISNKDGRSRPSKIGNVATVADYHYRFLHWSISYITNFSFTNIKNVGSFTIFTVKYIYLSLISGHRVRRKRRSRKENRASVHMICRPRQ